MLPRDVVRLEISLGGRGSQESARRFIRIPVCDSLCNLQEREKKSRLVVAESASKDGRAETMG